MPTNPCDERDWESTRKSEGNNWLGLGEHRRHELHRRGKCRTLCNRTTLLRQEERPKRQHHRHHERDVGRRETTCWQAHPAEVGARNEMLSRTSPPQWPTPLPTPTQAAHSPKATRPLIRMNTQSGGPATAQTGCTNRHHLGAHSPSCDGRDVMRNASPSTLGDSRDRLQGDLEVKRRVSGCNSAGCP